MYAQNEPLEERMESFNAGLCSLAAACAGGEVYAREMAATLAPLADDYSDMPVCGVITSRRNS
jgi:hypothetical protein